MSLLVFQVSVVNQQGQPIPGAGLRLLNPQGTDITASRFGSSPVYTDASGIFVRNYNYNVIEKIEKGIPPAIYSIVVSTPGYASQTIITPEMIGYGSFTATLEMAGSSAGVVTEPEFDYVSPLLAVEFTVEGLSPQAAWEYIEATITDSALNASVLEVGVTNGEAVLNLQARLELDSRLYLVGDTVAAIADPDFSDEFTVTLASLTPSGRFALDNSFSVQVANAFPIGEDNDLSNYTNIDGLADWLTPWEELPKFIGHYADAAIWLPIPSASAYQLQVDYQDINRESLNITDLVDLPSTLFELGKTVKIRIPDPIEGAGYALLRVTIGGIVHTHDLKIRYING